MSVLLELRDEVRPGGLLGLAIEPHVGAAVAPAGRAPVWVGADRIGAEIAAIEEAVSPRWVWWSKATARHLIATGVRPARCWDLAAVHRLIVGGWRDVPALVWAAAHDLDPAAIPTVAPVDLFSPPDDGDPNEPLRSDGHLRPDWASGSWTEAPERIGRWAELTLDVQRRQSALLDADHDDPVDRDDPCPWDHDDRDDPVDHDAHTSIGRERRHLTARCESAAEVLCAELEHDGLPFDRQVAESIIAGFVGLRPTDALDETTQLARLDEAVLRHLPSGIDTELRSPDKVKSLLRRVGIEVPDTRAWRLERLRDAHPIVEPLLAWRRAERIRTTFGYPWIDEHVGDDNRLRGSWSGSDGAAGRMTATAGLHNMPAELRPAVVAELGHVLVRADLGQIEPRVLAAVSADPVLARATQADDMYAPVADRLGVDRDVAKVAVLGAMYGQTIGRGAEALRGLEREYPIAMGYLRAADEAAQGGHDLWTSGGRRVRMSASIDDDASERDVRSRAAGRGRYGRNAVVQGAAAEFFKTWAVLVRLRGRELGATIVLCLHDELVVHAPAAAGQDVKDLLDRCLHEAAYRWRPTADGNIRFVADTSVVERWSDAK